MRYSSCMQSDPERRRRALQELHLLHPHPALVRAPLFVSGPPFFSAFDKLQVKYEMLRAHFAEGISVTQAARDHGFSRAAFYLALAAFEEHGLSGLLDERPGRRGPLKLTPEIIDHLRRAGPTRSGAELAQDIEQVFGVRLHRRTIERAR